MPDTLDLEADHRTAAQKFATAYYKATGRNIRLYFNQARHESYADIGYVEWLENQLEAVLAAAREAKADLSDARAPVQHLPALQ